MGKHDLVVKGLAAATEKGEGGTAFLAHMSEAMFGADDPDTKFYRWLTDNRQNLREAAAELGIEVEEGPGFAKRLRDAYLAKTASNQ